MSPMPICISRFPCRLKSTSKANFYADGEAVAALIEEREADEWGEPSRLVHRKLLRVEGPFGDTWADMHRSKQSEWRLVLGPRIGGLSRDRSSSSMASS